ncbi:unnamed protein product, partial [Rotaria magnacalcarata]
LCVTITENAFLQRSSPELALQLNQQVVDLTVAIV